MQNVKWKIPFVSLLDRRYEVHIYEENYSGSTITLDGAPNPFETSEDADAEYFMPIRTQSGYIRVIDYNGTLLEELIPNNNTQRLVRLVEIMEDNTMQTRWQGFLRAEAYTQEFTQNTAVVEIPVHSILSALADVNITSGYVGNIKSMGSLIYLAFTAIGNKTVGTNVLVNDVYVNDGTSGISSGFLLDKIQCSIFFNKVTYHNEGDSKTVFEGMSYYSILETICKFYGLMMREDGRDIIFSVYDATQNNNAIFYRLSWNDIASINNGSVPTPATVSNPIIDALTTLNFRGVDNNVTYNQGARSIKVVADIGSEEIDMNMELPQTTEDASTVYELPYLDVGDRAWIQVHPKRTGSDESFYYYEVDSKESSGMYPRLIGSSNYDKCLANSIVFNPTFDPHGTNAITHTGAIPVRWAHQKDTENIELLNGLLFNVYNMWSGYSYQPRLAYSLKTQSNFTLKNGWLNLDLSIRTIRNELTSNNPPQPRIFFDYRGGSGLWGDDLTDLYISIQYGNLYWNHEENTWKPTSSGISTITLSYKNGTMESNKPVGVPIDKEGGYFIPIPSEMTGKLIVSVYNIAQNKGTSLSNHNMHAFIVDKLNLTFLSTSEIPASSRSKNVYYKTILQSGFSDNMEIALDMATNNNNRRANALIFDSTGSNYLQSRNYTNGTLRPEIFLMNRIAEYYKKSRRAYLCMCEPLDSISKNIYTLNNKAFVPLASYTNWQDGIQEVKMLEMKDLS